MGDDQELRVLLPGELETIITSAQPSDIRTLGSPLWIEWHQRLQKLQQQAVLEASNDREEMTKNEIISSGKVPLLIYEAICISIWRQRILPEILTNDSKSNCMFILYAVLYHETVAVGLLELICHDEEACQSISELIIDLIDYCAEMFTELITLTNSKYWESKSNLGDCDAGELERQKCNLLFDIGLRCVTIISCVSNHLSKVHVSASGRLYSTHDFPLLLVEILQTEPWQRRCDNDVQIYSDGNWKTASDADFDKMSRHETLTWLALWHLLLNPELNNHYEVNNFRKGQLCKLIYRITDVRMDQVPVLVDLKRALGQLSVADVSLAPKGSKGPVFIEVIPQIKPKINRKIKNKESSIAVKQIAEYFTLDDKNIVDTAKKLSASYTSEVMENMDGSAKCAGCGDKAGKKCSRCKTEWYCGRECQVKRWGRHKEICDQFALLQ